MASGNQRGLNGRPMSTIALNFSAALDDIFKLGTVGELEETIEQKLTILNRHRNREVESQKSHLEDLDTRLREADNDLKKLEQKYKRMSRHFSSRPSVQGFFSVNSTSDTDDRELSSPGSETSGTSQG